MLEDVAPRLEGGAVVIARSVRVDGAGEGLIAAPLEAVARAHPDLALGSYPFFGPEGVGTNLVVTVSPDTVAQDGGRDAPPRLTTATASRPRR